MNREPATISKVMLHRGRTLLRVITDDGRVFTVDTETTVPEDRAASRPGWWDELYPETDF